MVVQKTHSTLVVIVMAPQQRQGQFQCFESNAVDHYARSWANL